MIYWRHSSSTGDELPTWLDGIEPNGSYAVRKVDDGDGHRVIGYCESWREMPPPEAPWRDCEDGWQAICWGQWDMPVLLRDSNRLQTFLVHDGEGREWPAPAVLHPYPMDALAFDVPLGPGWQPDPTPAQELLINASRWAREELLKGIYAGLDDRRHIDVDLEVTLPTEQASQATADLLCAVLHLSPGTLQACRLIDKHLISGVLSTAAGLNADMLSEIAERSDG